MCALTQHTVARDTVIIILTLSIACLICSFSRLRKLERINNTHKCNACVFFSFFLQSQRNVSLFCLHFACIRVLAVGVSNRHQPWKQNQSSTVFKHSLGPFVLPHLTKCSCGTGWRYRQTCAYRSVAALTAIGMSTFGIAYRENVDTTLASQGLRLIHAHRRLVSLRVHNVHCPCA